jgi:hypothetical protein
MTDTPFRQSAADIDPRLWPTRKAIAKSDYEKRFFSLHTQVYDIV